MGVFFFFLLLCGGASFMGSGVSDSLFWDALRLPRPPISIPAAGQEREDGVNKPSNIIIVYTDKKIQIEILQKLV